MAHLHGPDDILIYSRSFEDHLSALGEVFTQIRAAGLWLNARKCHLARDHVVFLGHVISAEGLRPDPKNTEKVKSWPVPRSATEVDRGTEEPSWGSVLTTEGL